MELISIEQIQALAISAIPFIIAALTIGFKVYGWIKQLKEKVEKVDTTKLDNDIQALRQEILAVRNENRTLINKLSNNVTSVREPNKSFIEEDKGIKTNEV